MMTMNVKMNMKILLYLLAGLPAFGAGSVNQTIGPLGPPPVSGPDTRVYLMQLLWTGDSINGTVPATVISIAQFPQLQGMRVISAEIQPNAPSPTSGYSLTLLDQNGVDLLAGVGSNLSATASSSTTTILSPPLVAAPTFNVAGNSVAGARGQLLVYFSPVSQITPNSGPGLTSTNAFTGTNTFKDINHQKLIDGVTYPLTGAGLQQAIADCIADVLCSDVDARQLGATTTTTTTSLTKPMRLWLGTNTVISGTSDPVMCFASSTAILGDIGDGTAGTIATIKSTAAASRVLAPCTPNPRTFYALFRGVDLWNSAAASTAIVLDMTGCNQCRVDNSFIQRSFGSASLVFITPASAGDAYFNVFAFDKLEGALAGAKAYDFENGANAQQIFGGKINDAGDCLFVSGSPTATNAIDVIGTSCESYTGTAIHTTTSVTGIHWYGGRMESAQGGANLFNIAGTTDVQLFGPEVFGTQGLGTDGGVVSWWGYTQGAPGPAFEAFMQNGGLSAPTLTANNGGTSTFTETANATDIVNFSGNATGNNNGVRFTNSAGGGHTWRFGEMFGTGRFSFRDITQTGNPAWSLNSTATGAFEGIVTHANTASRTYTFPDLSSGLPVSFSCGSTGSGNATCSPSVANTKTQIYNGESTLSANAATITFPNTFTSVTSYFCVANDVTTRANPVQMVPASANTATITNTAGATDVIQWICVGQ